MDIRPMLASKWEERNETMFPFWAQPKLDGIRVLIGEDGYAYTRSLKPVRSEYIQSLIRSKKDILAGLDGEIIVGDPTAEDCYVRTNSAVMSFSNDDAQNFNFCVFDKWNRSDIDYDSRYGELIEESLWWPEWTQLVPTALLSDMRMLDEYESKLLAEGHEGVILRRRDALYKNGRGTPKKGELIKLKRFEDMEGEIIAVHEFMHNGNPATINALGYTEHTGHKANLKPMNMLGAIEVKLDESIWPSGSVRIGTGFKMYQRNELWSKKDELIGKIAKFKYFSVGVKDAPRFPVFIGLRDPDDMDKQVSLF